MNSKSVIIRVLCLTLSAIAVNTEVPYYTRFDSQQPIARLPIYGPQIPIVAASVKSPPVVASIKSPQVVVPQPPVRARIGVKTVVRQPPPAPIAVPISQQPVPIIEQHELVIKTIRNIFSESLF